MEPSQQTCRHCGEIFISHSDKPGYIDECFECLAKELMQSLPGKRGAGKRPKRAPTLPELMEYIAAHPITVNFKTGTVLKEKTRSELRQKLEKKGVAPADIDKMLFVYMEPFEE
jgi:hypothetical protein